MFSFIKKKEQKKNDINNNVLLSKTASLLIHAAKIDENYTNKEKEIIKKALLDMGAEASKIEQMILEAEINEQKSNQMIDFTKEIKNASEEYKIKIIRTLWKIIYSDENADMYESNLMRRLCGLLYLDNKVIADIKAEIKKI